MDTSSRKSEIRRLDESLSVRDGDLFIEGCRATDLAKSFGTPVYVMSEDQLRRNARRFRKAFASRWPGEVLILPSIKANQSLALRRILTEEDTGCDAFGPGELEAALRTGTPPTRISLNGPMKTSPLLERAIEAGVRLTLDSRGELEETIAAARRLGTRAMVRLRVRPDLAQFDQPSEMSPQGASIRDATGRYKAGIPTNDLLGISQADVLDPAIDLKGVHLHLGRHSSDPEVWVGAIDALIELLGHLRDRWRGWTPDEIDLGGGFPVPRDPFGRLLPQRADAPETSPEAETYAAAICEHLAEGLAGMSINASTIRLEVEPGRSMYADAGVHLATIGNVKRQTEPVPLTWVETDSSDAYLADVNLEFSRWTCIAAGAADEPVSLEADVTGRTCALDVIVPSALLPEVRQGDVLAFLDTGAYQEAGAHNFNALPRPGTVLVKGDEAEFIRRHETIEDVFARDLIPERLGGDRLGSPGAPSRVSGLDHFSVTCADLERSIDFYSGLLGITVRARGTADDPAEFQIAGFDGTGVLWADLQLPHGQVLELIQYPSTATTSASAVTSPGATHIALRVADLDGIYRLLTEAGVAAQTPPITIDTPGAWLGARAFYTKDPDGVAVELIQQPKV